MRTRMYRWKMDPDKEERWLNEQSARGLALCDAFMVRYTFEDATPGKYIYRIEFLDKLYWTSEMRRYIQFIEESGAECVGAYGRWAYFRKPASEGAFEIHSDLASKIRHYNSMMAMYGVLGVPQLMFMLLRIVDILDGREESLMTVLAVLHGFLSILLLTLSVRTWRRAKRLKKEAQIRE